MSDEHNSIPSPEEIENYFANQGTPPAVDPQPVNTPSVDPNADPNVTPDPNQTPNQGDSAATPPPATLSDDTASRLQAMEQRQSELLGYIQGLTQVLQHNQNPQQQTQQLNTVQTPQEPNFEIPTEIPEELATEVEELWLENPAKATAKIAAWQQEAFMKAQWQKEQQQRQESIEHQNQLQQGFAEGYRTLITTHGDAVIEQYGPKIEEMMIKTRPELLQLPPQVGLALAFDLVRTAEAGQAPDPGSLLAQPDVRTKAKEALRAEIIQDYLRGIQSGATPPHVVANQPNTATPVIPQIKPQTLEESAKNMVNWLQNLKQ